jgi:rare lipoprotein A
MKRTTVFLLIITGIAAFSAAQTAGSEPFYQEGIASFYGREFDGRPTASGEIFDSGLFTAAHPSLPFNTILTVTNKQNMRRVTVRVNDRGPFVAARIIDLSRAAAEALDMITVGTAPVLLERAAGAALGPVPAPGGAAPAAAPAAAAAAVSPAESPAPQQATAPQATAQQAPDGLPAAHIIPGMPPAGSAKLYRLQVGSYLVPKNASDAFDKLKKEGLNPNYERYGDYYRVVLAGVAAGDISAIAQILGNAGFPEALIREETAR